MVLASSSHLKLKRGKLVGGLTPPPFDPRIEEKSESNMIPLGNEYADAAVDAEMMTQEVPSGGKMKSKLCKNTPSGGKKVCYYKGNEPSPKGFGFAARYEPKGKTKKGRDGKMWIVIVGKNRVHKWVHK